MGKVNIKPVINNSDFKVLSITGAPDDTLADHKVNRPAALIVNSGTITYIEADKQIDLVAGQIHEIPMSVIHSVRCTSDAQFFVVLGNEAKLRFEK